MAKISKQEGNERLKTLYAMLDGIPAWRLQMSSWRAQDKDSYTTPDDERLKQHTCKTGACAMGWAAANPEFQAMGLFWDKGVQCVQHTSIANNYQDGFDAAEPLFNITNDQSTRLFGPVFSAESQYGKITDKQAVLSRIRKFLLNRGAISAERNEELREYEKTRRQ